MVTSSFAWHRSTRWQSASLPRQSCSFLRSIVHCESDRTFCEDLKISQRFWNLFDEFCVTEKYEKDKNVALHLQKLYPSGVRLDTWIWTMSWPNTCLAFRISRWPGKCVSTSKGYALRALYSLYYTSCLKVREPLQKLCWFHFFASVFLKVCSRILYVGCMYMIYMQLTSGQCAGQAMSLSNYITCGPESIWISWPSDLYKYWIILMHVDSQAHLFHIHYNDMRPII